MTKNAYKFYYRSPFGATEYVYVIASSKESAFAYFKESGLFDTDYAYSKAPIDIISEKDFCSEHAFGDVLGEYAII